MRVLIIGAMMMLLSACAQTTLPTSTSVTDWQAFGKQSALDGLRELSKERIAKLDGTNHATPELIMAYQNGYQEGKQEYCEQSAYMLGVVGRPYFGSAMTLTRSSNTIMTLVVCLPQELLSKASV